MRLLVRVCGDTATVICEEVLGNARMAATNGLVREGTTWRMWHHHTSPIARRMTLEGSGLLI
ncbi:MAG: nuclear transport factor 2 family protein [Myxococcota bacterium]